MIELAELVEIMQSLGTTCSQEQINDIFCASARKTTDVTSLTFKEFLVSIATGHLLKLIPDQLRKLTGDPDELSAGAASAGSAPDSEVPEIVLAKRRKANSPAAAFDKVVDAFLYFDKNGDGYIEKDEMQVILSEDESGMAASSRRHSKDPSAKRKGSAGIRRKGSRNGSRGGGGSLASQFLTGARWEEIDWDKDGKITFKEFLLAVSGWVGLGEGGEDQD